MLEPIGAFDLILIIVVGMACYAALMYREFKRLYTDQLQRVARGGRRDTPAPAPAPTSPTPPGA